MKRRLAYLRTISQHRAVDTLLTTIRRVPDEQTLVLQCRPCGLSATETVDAPRPGESRP